MAKRGEKREQLDGDGLTPRMRRFCLEYLANGCNGSEAARAAGYSERTAASIAHENLGKPAVKAFLEPRLRQQVQRLEKRLELNAERLDQELARCAYLDPGELQDPETGAPRQLKDLPEDVRRTVAGVKVREIWTRGSKKDPAEHVGNVVEFKLAPKVQAIELGYKRLGLLKEKLEVTAKLSHEQLLVLAQRLRERKLAARSGAVGGTPAAPARGAGR